MSAGNNHIARVYLMLYCPIGERGEEHLKSLSIKVPAEKQSCLECSEFTSKGSSFHPPFLAFEIGFKQLEYDYDHLASGIDDLFSVIDDNKNRLINIISLGDIKSIFVVNFNCQKPDQRPAFDLSSEQLKILGEVGASLSLDSYLAF